MGAPAHGDVAQGIAHFLGFEFRLADDDDRSPVASAELLDDLVAVLHAFLREGGGPETQGEYPGCDRNGAGNPHDIIPFVFGFPWDNASRQMNGRLRLGLVTLRFRRLPVEIAQDHPAAHAQRQHACDQHKPAPSAHCAAAFVEQV